MARKLQKETLQKRKSKKSKIEEFVDILKKMPDTRKERLRMVDKLYPKELESHILEAVADKILDETIETSA